MHEMNEEERTCIIGNKDKDVQATELFQATENWCDKVSAAKKSRKYLGEEKQLLRDAVTFEYHKKYQ